MAGDWTDALALRRAGQRPSFVGINEVLGPPNPNAEPEPPFYGPLANRPPADEFGVGLYLGDDLVLYACDGAAWSTIGPASAAGGGTAAGFTGLIGDGVTVVFTVAHNLGRNGLVWSVLDVTAGDYVWPTVAFVNINTLRFTFATAPAANQMRVTVGGF